MNRPKWKGFFIKPENHTTQVSNSSKKVSRNSSIIPKFIEQTFKIHTAQ